MDEKKEGKSGKRHGRGQGERGRAYPAQSLMSGGPVADPSPKKTPYTPNSLRKGERAGGEFRRRKGGAM